jgi:hypothetical protein
MFQKNYNQERPSQCGRAFRVFVPGATQRRVYSGLSDHAAAELGKSQRSGDSPEHGIDLVGERRHACSAGKGNKGNKQGILDQILALFPGNKTPHYGACAEQKLVHFRFPIDRYSRPARDFGLGIAIKEPLYSILAKLLPYVNQ